MSRIKKTWSTPRKTEDSRLVPCALCGSRKFKPSLKCEGFSYVSCANCGLVQINPQPLVSEVINRYGPSEDYLSYEIRNEDSFLRLQLLALGDAGFEALENELKTASDKKLRVLDIGCATGALLDELRKRGWECTGIEISKAEAEYARAKRGLSVHNLPLEECCFPEASFDIVLASHLIEHLNDPASLVNEVKRVLVPGGSFFVTTPNISGFQARLFGGLWRSAIFDHLYLFSRKTLRGLLEKKGFTVEKIATWGGLAEGVAPAPVKRLFDRAAKRLGFGDVMIMRASGN